ncbi:MAG TPA: hypothetical protein VFG69_02140 [Nannocystaceae bacterium]|nr:hypothetical protein [Nannocystaceae bacterium]
MGRDHDRIRGVNPMARAPTSSSFFAAAVIGLAPASAAAGDGIRPRTVVVWPDDVPCSIAIDRATDPVVHLPYSILAEDPPAGATITDDEVEDGRRHQFFAFSADIDPRIAMPEWITMADVERAAALDLVDVATVESDSVLESHPILADTFARIDADDARRPITFAMADAGVDWDTSALAPGPWIVRAYTWDPWPNAWSAARTGVIAVGDDADPGSHAPALAVHASSDVLYRDDVGTIAGCVIAMEGTTVSADWAFFGDPAGEWLPFAHDEPVDGDAFELAFTPPESLWGQFAVIRVVATDPLARSWTAYVPTRITVLASDRPQQCDEPDPACDTSGGLATTDSGSEGADGHSPTTSAAADGSSGTNEPSTSGDDEESMRDPQGCGCGAAPRPARELALLGLVLLVQRRRTA